MTQPPIVPGHGENYTLGALMPAPEQPRRARRWLLPIGIAVVALAGAAVWFGPGLFNRLFGPAPLREAYTTCGSVGGIADNDTTLILDMRGEKSGSGTAAVTDLVCILDALDAPAYIVAEMDKTRALDGRQSGEWGTFEASWTYHPDQGLDVIIREVSK